MGFAQYAYLLGWLVVLAGLYAAIYFMAVRGFIITFVGEGEIMVITNGPKGSFVKPLYSIRGQVYDEKTRRFVEETVANRKRSGILETLLGIQLIGPIPRQLYTWEFYWNKLGKKSDQSTEYEIVPKWDKKTKVIKWQYPYALQFKNVEIDGQYQIDLDFLATLRTVSPYNALFLTSGKWLETSTGIIEGVVRGFYAGLPIEEVLKMKKGTNQDLLNEFRGQIAGLKDKLFDLAGQESINIEFLDYEIVGAADLKEAAQKKEKTRLEMVAEVLRATEQAKATREKSMGEADAIRNIADAERERLEKTTVFAAGGPGPNAVEFEKWRAMGSGKSNLNTYVEGGAKAKTNVNVGQNTPPPPAPPVQP